MSASEAQVASRRESLNALGYIRCLHNGDENEARKVLETMVIDFSLFWSAVSAMTASFLGIIDRFSDDSRQFLANGHRMMNSNEIIGQLFARMSIDDPANWSEL